MSTSSSIRALWLGAAWIVVVSVYGAYVVMPRESMMDHTSSVWIAQSVDASQNRFYRPVNSAEGFGGTRYFPVHIVLQAALIRLGCGPIASAYVMTTVSLFLLMAGVAYVLRSHEFSWSISIAVATLVLCAESIQKVWLGPRGDILPVAFNLLGLSLCIKRGELSDSKRHLILAGILFGCGFATKVTSLFGPLSVCAAFLLSGRRKDVAIVGGASLVSATIILGATNLATDGRFISIFSQAAMQGVSIYTAFYKGSRTLVWFLEYGSPFGLVLFLCAVATLVFSWKTTWREPVTLALICSILITSFTLASPGTYYNQLIDLFVLSLLYFVIKWRHLMFSWALVLLAAVAFISGVHNIGWYADRNHTTNRAELFASILSAIGPGDQPILSEDPIIPIKDGARPYMLDPFMYRYLSLSDPSLNQHLFSEIASRHFRAVVFIRNPADPKNDGWYSRTHFGTEVIREVYKHYSVFAEFGEYVILKPSPE